MEQHVSKYRLQLVQESITPAYNTKVADSAKAVFELLYPYVKLLPHEEFICVFLDAKHHISGWIVVSMGSLTMSIVHPRESFKAAIAGNACSVVFVHNHPSGDPTPSQEDRKLTDRLVLAGEILGVRVLDHVVMGEGRYVSFADQGWIHYGESAL